MMLAHGQTVRVTAPTLARARASARGTNRAAAARIVQVRPPPFFAAPRGGAKRARTRGVAPNLALCRVTLERRFSDCARENRRDFRVADETSAN
jgi:hypothetical protein